MRKHPSIALLIVLAGSLAAAQDSKPAHLWTYKGKEGPSAWGDLKAEYSTCRLGHTQSPIDIRGAQPQSLPQIQFDYKPVPLKILNNGHTVKIIYAPGSSITVGDKHYELKEFHFHHPSEEHVNGRGYDMVAHFVHADSEGKLAVVAVLLKKGQANGAIEKIWQSLPKDEGPEREVPGAEVNAAALLPQSPGYYTFAGSLTTPPCSEGVTWFVLKTPVELSAGQIGSFAEIYPLNARPIQPSNGRPILETQ